MHTQTALGKDFAFEMKILQNTKLREHATFLIIQKVEGNFSLNGGINGWHMNIEWCHVFGRFTSVYVAATK